MGICVYCLHEDQANLRSKYEALAAIFARCAATPSDASGLCDQGGRRVAQGLVADRLRP